MISSENRCTLFKDHALALAPVVRLYAGNVRWYASSWTLRCDGRAMLRGAPQKSLASNAISEAKEDI
jgi:hypothetical protein